MLDGSKKFGGGRVQRLTTRDDTVNAELAEEFGQAVTAVVAADGDDGPDAQSIIDGVKRQLAGYKAPKHVVFVTRVPRAPNGKADYTTARRQAADSLGRRA